MPTASAEYPHKQTSTIRLKVYSPYHTWVNDQHEIALLVEGPVTVRSMLALLGAHYARFAGLANCDEVAVRNRFALICDGRVLALDDPVPHGVTIDLVPPLSGG